MPQYATAGKKAAEGPKKGVSPSHTEGSGHHNLLMIRDYATGGWTFRAETEIHLTDQNGPEFDKLKALLPASPLTSDHTKEILAILMRQVDAMPDDKTPASGPEGRARAKAIFAAALGELKLDS